MEAEKRPTAVGIVAKRNPLVANEIKKCLKKWNKRTKSNPAPWPLEGTFDVEQCNEMEVLIKNHKPKEKTAKRTEKRNRELTVLSMFQVQGNKLREATRRHAKTMTAQKEVKSNVTLPPYSLQMPVKKLTLMGDYEVRSDKREGSGLYPTAALYKMKEREGCKSQTEESTERIKEQYRGRRRAMGRAARDPAGFHEAIRKRLKEAEEEDEWEEEGGVSEMEEEEFEEADRLLSEAEGKLDQSIKKREEYDRQKEQGRKHTKKTSSKAEEKEMSKLKLSLSSMDMGRGSDEECEKGAVSGVLTLTSRDSASSSRRASVGSSEAKLLPLLAKGPNMRYVPWGTMDMEGLIQRLPCIQEGASKWIAAFEDETIAVILAMGDVKALWGKILGKHEMEELLLDANLEPFVKTQANDADVFNRYRNILWSALRQRYPTRIQPDSITTASLTDAESPQAYVHTTRKEWIKQTGMDPDHDAFHQMALRKRIIEGLPQPVQSRLGEAVGLYNMTSGQFTDHVVDAVTKYRTKLLRQKQEDEESMRKLTQQQLAANKKRVQAVMIPASNPVPAPTPALTPVPLPEQHVNTQSQGRAPGLTQPQVIVIQQPTGGAGGYNDTGRGRGGPMRGRGRGYGYRNNGPRRGPSNEPPTCWGCGKLGHQRRNCRENPWENTQGGQGIEYVNPPPRGPVNPWQGPPAGY